MILCKKSTNTKTHVECMRTNATKIQIREMYLLPKISFNKIRMYRPDSLFVTDVFSHNGTAQLRY